MSTKTKVAYTLPDGDETAARKADLQELYRYLDHSGQGDTYLAWYGQARALGLSHRGAIADTIIRYDLARQNWWLERNLPVFEPQP